MPEQEKRPIEMTTEEAMRKLFPKEVVDEAKRAAEEARLKVEHAEQKKSTRKH